MLYNRPRFWAKREGVGEVAKGALEGKLKGVAFFFMPAKRPISPSRVDGKWPNFPPLRRDNELVTRYIPWKRDSLKDLCHSFVNPRIYVHPSRFYREKFI